jgi:hypothetical protein
MKMKIEPVMTPIRAPKQPPIVADAQSTLFAP